MSLLSLLLPGVKMGGGGSVPPPTPSVLAICVPSSRELDINAASDQDTTPAVGSALGNTVAMFSRVDTAPAVGASLGTSISVQSNLRECS